MNGLTDKEVLESRKKYGSNTINVKNENKFISLFIETLGDPIIKIMLIALAVRVVFLFSSFNWYETLGMMISILLSSLISSVSEYGSNKAFSKLEKKYNNINVKVKRNNELKEISCEDLVVGDIVYIQAGEIIPADGYLISGKISIDESSINGESKENNKTINDKVFKGTIALNGSCIIKINAVGINTIYGDIAASLNEKTPDSPMKIRLRTLANNISKIGLIGAFLVFISYLFNVLIINNNFNLTLILEDITNLRFLLDNIIYAVTLALTIIIVVIPEGLPMMIALVLSSNMKRMLKKNVLVRKLVGIETCGSMNVLLSDKTGTLTKGKLKVIGFIDSLNIKYNYLNEIPKNKYDIILEALLYNNESMKENNKIIGGNQTDKAILEYIGYHSKKEIVLKKQEFNSNIKYSSVTLSNGYTYYKGAPEVILDKCTYYYDNELNKKIIRDKNNYIKTIQKYTSKGYRVIGVSKDNIYLGIILIKDEIRESSKEVLENLEAAGIQTIMITGDDKLTSETIAKELGMIKRNSKIITHDELVNLSDDYIKENYRQIKVISRALPSDKARIAKILESMNLVVGMTGDGINDAPALKCANVGFAIGSGSDVAKEASDIVILDDNIKSIENAVLYGKTIFKSIRKFIIFQLTMNFSALALSIVGPLIGITSPVTIMQMLWINMIMDTLAGLAFAKEAPLKRYMKEKTIKKDEKILNKYMINSIVVIGLYISLLLILFLKVPIFKTIFRTEEKYHLTAFFSIFIFISIFNAFNTRTPNNNIFYSILKNKTFLCIMGFIFLAQIYLIYYGGSLFRTYGLNIKELIYVLLISISVIPVDIIRKLIYKKFNKETL